MAKIQDETLRLNIVVNGDKAQKEIGKLEAQNRKLKDSNEDLRKSKQRLIAEGKKESQQYKNITKEMAKNSLEIKENKTKMGALRKELGLTGLTTKQLAQEQRRLKTILASTTPNTAAYKQYKKELQAVNGRLGELRVGAKKTGGIIGKMKASFGGIGALAAGAFGIGALLKFGNVAADNVSILNKVKSTLQQITGLKGLELKRATAGIKGVADAYQKDTKQMSEAVHNFAEGMEIDFNDALDLVKQGFLDGADANEEFLDKLREYPVLLKEAGFSAEESIALMTQEVKSGIYSDKGVDAIKEANLRLREMTPAAKEGLEAIGISSEKVQEELTNGSKTTFEVMQQVSKKLSELPPQSAEVGQAIADIFGGPGEDAGLKYLANLQNINLETSKLTTTSNEYLEAKKLEIEANEAMNLVWLKLTGTGSNLNKFYSKLRLGIASVLGGQKDLTGEFEDQADRVIDLNNELVPLIDEYDDLKLISEKSTDEQERLKTVIGEIASITPTAITAFDEYGNALDISSDKARGFIETQKALLVFRNKEAIEEQTEALKDYETEVEQLQKRLNRTDEDGNVLITKSSGSTGGGGVSTRKATGAEISELQARLGELQQLEVGAQESINQLSGDYLDKYIKRQEDQTKVTLEETKKRADVLGIEYSDDITQEALNALILQQQRLSGLSKQDRENALKDLETFGKQKLKLQQDAALREEEDEFKRKALKIQQNFDAREKEIENLQITAAEKQELKDLLDEEKRAALEELNLQKEETELKRIQDFENRKKALQNEIDLLNEETKLEKEILKAEQEFNKQEEELNKLELNSLQKQQLLELLTTKEEQVKEDIRNKFAKKFLKESLEVDKKVLEADKASAKAREDVANILTGALIGLLGDSLGAKLASIAIDAAIQAGLVKITAASSISRNLAQAAASLPPPANLGPLALAGVQNATIAAGATAATAKIIGAAALQGLGTLATKGFQDGKFPIIREQDGKKFNAKSKSSSHTQLVTEPTYFSDANILTGEGGPEIIIDTPTLKNLDPEVVRNIYVTAARTRGLETGLYQQSSINNNNAVIQSAVDVQDRETNNQSNEVMQMLVEVLADIQENGLNVPPPLIGDGKIKELNDRNKKLNKTRDNAKINSIS